MRSEHVHIYVLAVIMKAQAFPDFKECMRYSKQRIGKDKADKQSCSGKFQVLCDRGQNDQCRQNKQRE